MINKHFLYVIICSSSLFSYAQDPVDTQEGLTKEDLLSQIASDELEPRELQILANTFYWSHRYKKAVVAATHAAKKNTLMAHNILFATYNAEYASDKRVSTVFNEFHEAWKTAQEMQHAQNACVGILSFKEKINDIANYVLSCICMEAPAALKEHKDSVLARATKLIDVQSACSAQATQLSSELEMFYNAVESEDLEVMLSSTNDVKQHIDQLMRKHLTATHTYHDIRTDIVIAMENHFAKEFLAWYGAAYNALEHRGLTETPYGTILCDHTGLLEEEQRTKLPDPATLKE